MPQRQCFWSLCSMQFFFDLMAGIAEMPYGKFFLCNLAGATVWASVMVTLAFFVGRIVSLEQLIAWVAQFTLVWLCFSSLPGLLYPCG